MKKFLLIISLFLAAYLKVSANEADLFSYNKVAVQTALSDLSVLESYVIEHPALAIVNVTKSGSLMINGIELFTNPFMGGGDAPLGIPAFFWGCVLGIIGVAIVYFATNGDMNQVKNAIFGCIPWVVVWIIWYFLIYDVAKTVTNPYIAPGY